MESTGSCDESTRRPRRVRPGIVAVLTIVLAMVGFTVVPATPSAAATITALKPTITGTARQGSTLTAVPGAWQPAGVTLTYKWYRSGHRISGATSPTYTLVGKDKGKRITVKVTGHLSGASNTSKTSARTAKVKGLSLGTNKLTSVRDLTNGQYIRSSNGTFRLTMQPDGNLVEKNVKTSAVVWTSNTPGTGNYVRMQSDGNLVIYDSARTVKWSTNTSDFSGGYLYLQDDGSLRVYRGGVLLWSRVSGYLADRLLSGYSLKAGDTLRSPNHQYKLAMQTDGNLVEYGADGKAIWASDTSGTGNYASMQTDGNLVVYSSARVAKWSSNTSDFPGSVLWVKDDGSLRVFRNQVMVWSRVSGYLGARLQPGVTLNPEDYLWSENHQHKLLMQGDGNLVVYTRAGKATWASGVSSGRRVVMQDDGNLVIYDGNTAKWASDTAGHSGAYLVLQDDGTLQVISGGSVLWSSGGGPAGPYNAGIIASAARFADGAAGGQCLVFAENRIRDAGGPSIAMGLDGSTYQAQWASHATQVSWAQAMPGDIIQWYDPNGTYGTVHTAILTGGNSEATGTVVDSNYGLPLNQEQVHRGSFSSRMSGFHAGTYKIWRVHA